MADDSSSGSSDDPTIVQIAFNYEPSKVAAGITGGLYLLAGLALFTRLIKAKSWWGLCLPIASLITCSGFFVRIALDSSPNSVGVFTVEQLFIIVTPAAFLAFNYILYGRFIVNCVDPKYSLIRPNRVARLFVCSDIITFLVQGGGGGLETSNNRTTGKIGVRILLVGLVLQLISYACFVVILVHTHHKIVKDARTNGLEPWWKLIWLLYFSSVCILIRGIYRTAEFAQGQGGYLVTHEIYFYLLDALPLLLAISIYIPFWPAKYLNSSIDEYKMRQREVV
ncbi:hypothetical protein PILCRDRAFT_827692 [Piloderma croceum F 1598]|uniref:RTA1 like protein n=1 Tax=Piloderma croceum (strain F 1598) TaxID=765440 RepID=A0A0C3BCD3_PILCF|nr:hypothetical protein PILCRDRAFT_827692 [Piloderma croceum F 1598]